MYLDKHSCESPDWPAESRRCLASRRCGDASVVVWVKLLHDERTKDTVLQAALRHVVKVVESFSAILAIIVQSVELEDSPLPLLFLPEKTVEKYRICSAAAVARL